MTKIGQLKYELIVILKHQDILRLGVAMHYRHGSRRPSVCYFGEEFQTICHANHSIDTVLSLCRRFSVFRISHEFLEVITICPR